MTDHCTSWQRIIIMPQAKLQYRGASTDLLLFVGPNWRLDASNLYKDGVEIFDLGL